MWIRHSDEKMGLYGALKFFATGKLSFINQLWRGSKKSYLPIALSRHEIGSHILLDNNEIIFNKKNTQKILIVKAIKRSHIVLYGLSDKKYFYKNYSKIINNYFRMDRKGKRYCFDCMEFHKEEDFYRDACYCKKTVDDEVKYQIHLLNENHHHPHFKDGPNYGYFINGEEYA